MNRGKLRPSSRAVDPRAVAAVDAMWSAAKRPPPPLPRFTAHVRSAGALELEREKRLGLYSTHGAYFHD